VALPPWWSWRGRLKRLYRFSLWRRALFWAGFLDILDAQALFQLRNNGFVNLEGGVAPVGGLYRGPYPSLGIDAPEHFLVEAQPFIIVFAMGSMDASRVFCGLPAPESASGDNFTKGG